MTPETVPSFHDAYPAVLRRIQADPDHDISTRGNISLEVLDVCFRITDPRQRVPYLVTRPINIAYNWAEVLWYVCARNDLDMIGYYAPSMAHASGDGHTLTGTAYGPPIFGPRLDGRSQWERVLDLLGKDPDSKRAVLSVFGPDELADLGNPDVSCTIAAQFLLREGALHASVYMRGNDAFMGMPSDVFSFTVLQELAAVLLARATGHLHPSRRQHAPQPAAPGQDPQTAGRTRQARLPAARPDLPSDAGHAPHETATTARRAGRTAAAQPGPAHLHQRHHGGAGAVLAAGPADLRGLPADPALQPAPRPRGPGRPRSGLPVAPHPPMAQTHARSGSVTPAGGWGRWTVVLCKPDATTRNLVEPILEWIGGHVRIVASRQTVVTAPQILTHYADMLELQHRFPFNVETDLRTHYVGATITVALATGDDDTTARRVRDLLGHYDPAVADPRTIRGHFGRDSADKAATEGRFIHNLVHSSDDADAAQRDFSIWFGTPYLHLLKEEPPR